MIEGDTVAIRGPRVEDLPELVKLYNHYVRTSHATFDVVPQTVEQRRSWFDGFTTDGSYRLLVAELADQVVGYASSTQFRRKPAYDTSVETTIYVDPAFTGRGIGSRLYQKLLDDLVGHDKVHQAFAGIAIPNPGSIVLHERFGFTFVGTFREVGYKFGKYWSVSWYQKNC